MLHAPSHVTRLNCQSNVDTTKYIFIHKKLLDFNLELIQAVNLISPTHFGVLATNLQICGWKFLSFVKFPKVRKTTTIVACWDHTVKNQEHTYLSSIYLRAKGQLTECHWSIPVSIPILIPASHFPIAIHISNVTLGSLDWRNLILAFMYQLLLLLLRLNTFSCANVNCHILFYIKTGWQGDKGKGMGMGKRYLGDRG